MAYVNGENPPTGVNVTSVVNALQVIGVRPEKVIPVGGFNFLTVMFCETVIQPLASFT